ncbi:hypothetical protein BV22DRAFT_1107402 [Leucogyrophana mollusca]|uniref:Uncharacterized protein n=1 Tax=Leucogyrophana mollusca TaxID=85980 RepID=A0ACB8B5V7_9AGAM|nr:hypothetical protein BV22DRAFT_1107402 [Leucogyrophana mollusca]
MDLPSDDEPFVPSPPSDFYESSSELSPPPLPVEIKRPLAVDVPRPLRAVRYSSRKRRWAHTSNCAKGVREPLPSSLRLVSWNVDFMSQQPKKRLTAAISHIQHAVFECKTPSERPEPCCILLQEVDVSAFTAILNNEWIQRCFLVVPASTDHWPYKATYGNVTLVSRTLPVCGAFTIDFGNSDMRRNALFVDIKLSGPPPADHAPTGIVTIRIANTHLESLPIGARARPEQMKLIAEALEEDGIRGGVVAGDMNAIGPTDLTITQDVGLCDAWQGDEDDEEGYTWGYQPRCEFPPGRLDKVLFTIRDGFEVEQPERIGIGEKIAHGKWISDHYGLVTSVHVEREE